MYGLTVTGTLYKLHNGVQISGIKKMPFGTAYFQILNNTFWTIKILRFRDYSRRV